MGKLFSLLRSRSQKHRRLRELYIQ